LGGSERYTGYLLRDMSREFFDLGRKLFSGRDCIMTTQRIALNTGITGQDGAYLAKLLLAKGYKNTALSAGSCCLTPIGSITCIKTRINRNFILHYGDL